MWGLPCLTALNSHTLMGQGGGMGGLSFRPAAAPAVPVPARPGRGGAEWAGGGAGQPATPGGRPPSRRARTGGPPGVRRGGIRGVVGVKRDASCGEVRAVWPASVNECMCGRCTTARGPTTALVVDQARAVQNPQNPVGWWVGVVDAPHPHLGGGSGSEPPMLCFWRCQFSSHNLTLRAFWRRFFSLPRCCGGSTPHQAFPCASSINFRGFGPL